MEGFDELKYTPALRQAESGQPWFWVKVYSSHFSMHSPYILYHSDQELRMFR